MEIKEIKPNFDFESIGVDANDLINEVQKHSSIENNQAGFYDWKNELESLRIDTSKKIQPPEVVWKIRVNDKVFNAGTKGNFSAIIGKPKSKKTYSLTMFLADYFSSETKKNILYFDTEQSEYHASKAIDRIRLKNGIRPQNLKAYHLRSKSTKERLELIERAIYDNDNVEIVIIDGIRDLITSINDEEQATMIVSKLLKWTEERNIHIITVLHQNKGDNNARGHVGTELMNKAELVLSVTKSDEDKDISFIETVVSRNIEVDEFAFKIDENGVPNVVDEWTKKSKDEKTNKIQVHQIDNETYKKILEVVFTTNDKPKYKELSIQLDLAIQTISGVEIGNTKLQKMIQYLQNEKLLFKVGKDKSPTAFYTNVNPEIKESENLNLSNELEL